MKRDIQPGINQHRRLLEKFISEDIDMINMAESESDILMDKVFPWIFRNVMPVLIIGLMIDIIIMFSVPVETTMTSCFWLKDPISLCMGFLIVRVFYFLRNRILPCKA